MFSCLPVDGLPCHGQTSELLHISIVTSNSTFHVTSNSNFSDYIKLKFFLLRQSQLFLILCVPLCGVVRRTRFFYSTPSACQLNSSAQTPSASQFNSVVSLLNSAASLPNSVFFAYLLCEKSLPSVRPFILHTP